MSLKFLWHFLSVIYSIYYTILKIYFIKLLFTLDHVNKKSVTPTCRWVEKTLHSRSSKRKVTIDPCIYCRGVTCDSPVDPDFPDMRSVRSLRFPSNLCCSLNYLLACQYLREWAITFLNASIPSSTPSEIHQI